MTEDDMNKTFNSIEAFRFASDLTEFATDAKRRTLGLEQQYWQGVADTCRKFTAIMLSSAIYPNDTRIDDLLADKNSQPLSNEDIAK
jgi:hypothetical protein